MATMIPAAASASNGQDGYGGVAERIVTRGDCTVVLPNKNIEVYSPRGRVTVTKVDSTGMPIHIGQRCRITPRSEWSAAAPPFRRAVRARGFACKLDHAAGTLWTDWSRVRISARGWGMAHCQATMDKGPIPTPWRTLAKGLIA